MLLVSPILLDESVTAYEDPTGNGFDARSLDASRALAPEIQRVAEERGVLFADAASVARAGGDGLHLTLDSHEPLARLIADLVVRASPRSVVSLRSVSGAPARSGRAERPLNAHERRLNEGTSEPGTALDC